MLSEGYWLKSMFEASLLFCREREQNGALRLQPKGERIARVLSITGCVLLVNVAEANSAVSFDLRALEALLKEPIVDAGRVWWMGFGNLPMSFAVRA